MLRVRSRRPQVLLAPTRPWSAQVPDDSDMTTVPPPPKGRDNEVDLIALAALEGVLGLFIGTGFSKAATSGSAPGFEDLLRQLAVKLGATTPDPIAQYRCKSLPQIASQLLEEFVAKSPSREYAEERFRAEIAQLCHLTPDPSARNLLGTALRGVTPAWIITTNYDLVLEYLVDGASSVLPTQPLAANLSRVPVYHLHGSRRSPSTIKITEEDYVSLIGPIDYQRLKLPLLMLESTTVMLGYSLGDINVRAAMAWSNSFRGERGLRLDQIQGRVVQALYSTTPRRDPYPGPNGETVIEISDIGSFLQTIGSRREAFERATSSVKESTEAFFRDPGNAAAVATDSSKRAQFLSIIRDWLALCDSSALTAFIDRALEPIWAQAMQPQQFSYYATYLSLLLDILKTLVLEQARPGIISYLGDALEKIAFYIDPNRFRGSAFAATDLWLSKHREISDGIKRELLSYAVASQRPGLVRLLSFAGCTA